MLNIDFTSPIDQVRMNVGDIDQELVSNTTIQSALTVYNNSVVKASVAIFQMLCTYFATLADKEQVGELQVEYRKRFENYKQRLKDFLDGNTANKKFLPFLIGGTSRSKKEEIYANQDNFSMYDQAEWNNNRLGGRTLYDMMLDDLNNAFHNHY